MKQRIFTGWNFQRILFLLMGVVIIIQAVADKQWMVLVPGGYIASMAVFNFGCASGSCYSPVRQQPEVKADEIKLNDGK